MSGRIMFSNKLGYDGIIAVPFGWFISVPFGWFIAERLVVTINVSEAEVDPWVATTWTNPTDDDKGTVKLAKNSPLLVVVTVAGVVVRSVSLNVIATVELGSNPVPVIFTKEPTRSEVELSVMVGATEDVSINVSDDEFDDELDPWVALGFTMSVWNWIGSLTGFNNMISIRRCWRNIEGSVECSIGWPCRCNPIITLEAYNNGRW
jgi:hypothetical protein